MGLRFGIERDPHAVSLHHVLVQDRDDSGMARFEPSPVDQVASIGRNPALNVIPGERARPRHVLTDLGERLEKSTDIGFGLRLSQRPKVNW